MPGSARGLVVVVGLTVGLSGLVIVANAGPLDPPAGPIAPTYKTLTEVEPRTIVNSVNTPGNATSSFVISQPGSYYLDRNLVGTSGRVGIRITASNVKLDLNGFSVQGVAGALDGIAYTGDYITIRNGTIRNWPGNGASFVGTGFNTLVEDVVVQNNTGFGLFLRDGCTVRRVKVEFNTGGGVRLASFSRMTESTIRGNGAASGTSVQLFDGAEMEGCYIDSGGAATIGATLASSFPLGCSVRNNTFALGGGTDAIVISGQNHVIDSNTILGQNTANSAGIVVQSGTTGIVVRDNIVKNTADNYNLLAGGNNQYQLILSQIPESIDVPAIVKLSGTLNLPTGSTGAGIAISASDVTLDMTGGGIVGVPTSGNGIIVTNNAINLHVMNGTVSGFNAGIVINDGAGSNGANSIIENMHIRSNRREAVLGGNVLRMTNCTVVGNGSAAVPTVRGGDGCIIENVNLAGNTNTGSVIQLGTSGHVTNCNVANNTGNGIEVGNASIVRNSIVERSGGYGIAGAIGASILDNTVRENQFEGIIIGTSGLVRGNKLDFNGRAPLNQAGILAAGVASIIEQNSVTGSDVGYSITGTRIFVSQNRASSNTVSNYSIFANNSHGPIVNVGLVGNFAGVANSTHPQANFEH